MDNSSSPDSIRELFRRILDLLRRTAGRTVLLGLLAGVPGALVLALGLILGSQGFTGMATTQGGQAGGSLGITLIGIVLFFLGLLALYFFTVWCYLAVIAVTDDEMNDDRMTLRDALGNMREYISKVKSIKRNA